MDLSEQAVHFRTVYGTENSAANSEMQMDLITEEFSELLQAHNALMYNNNEKMAECTLKELADLVFVCFQYAENREWDLLEALNRVYRSNMSKLDESERPIYRDDGKILKGPNYKAPELNDLVVSKYN